MKRTYTLICTILLLVMLGGCLDNGLSSSEESTSQAVGTGQEEAYTDTTAYLEDGTAIDKMTLADLKRSKQQEIEKVMNFTSDNLIFDTGFDFDVPDEIGKYQVIRIKNFHQQAELIFEKYVPADIYDDSKVTLDERYTPYGPDFKDEETGMCVSTGNTGFFVFIENTFELIRRIRYEEEGIMTQKIYYLNSDYTNDSYTLQGGNTSISEAVASAAGFASDFTQTFHYPQDLKPEVAAVYEDESGNDAIGVFFSGLYKGLPIYTMFDRYIDLTQSDLGLDMFIMPSTDSYLAEKDVVHTFTVQEAYEDYKTLEIYETIITPACAVHLLSEELSSYTEYNVIGMELVYCPVEVPNETFDPDDMYSDYIIELSPYWAIYMDVTPGKEIYGLVDCVTGEVGFVNNAR